jgi:glycosyltransferase involved in cell wall biosynthesis
MTRFAITISSHGKNNTLKETLESVKNQTYKNWYVYLIGDNYPDEYELEELSKIIPKDKIFVENREAQESKKYQGLDLWHYGGSNNWNYAMDMASDWDIIAHLDHDDVWEPEHLELIAKVYEENPDIDMVFTAGAKPGGQPIPDLRRSGERALECGQVCHSAATYKNIYHYRYNNMPADCDMWARLKRGYFIPKQTVNKHHAKRYNNPA